MPSPLSNVIDQARMWWDGSPTSTRAVSVGLAALVVLCLIGAAMLAATPDYQDLFTNLDPHDAAAIAAKLDDAHEKYEMTDGDTTIRVPSADKDRLRMEMVRDGLPVKTGSVVGSDWLDKIGMSTTSDVQGQYIKLANEGELSQTISSMNEISTASVHITEGTNSPFATDNAPPTASVVVGLKDGMSLTSDQIMGIANLVAKSVTGLDLKNVAVVDTNGNQLWDGGSDAGIGGLASNRMVAEKQFSDDLRKQMQSYLDAVLGSRKSLVSVHAELNFNQVQSHQTTYGKGAVLSSEESDEKYSGTSGSGSPVPAGVAANTPGGTTAPTYPTASAAAGKSGTYENQVDKNNFSNDKTETETQQAPGSIQRLAVAVLIDNTVPAATITSIQTYLSTLAGVTANDPTRIVTVQPVPFSTSDMVSQQTMMKTVASQQRMDEFMKIGAVALVAIILLFIFLRATKSAGGMQAGGGQQQLGSSNGQAALAYANNGEALLDEPMSIEDVLNDMPMPTSRPKRKPLIPEIEEQMDVKLESVREMVKTHPSSVALLMKGWMADQTQAD